MRVSEWDLFPPTVYGGDPNHPTVTCSGVAGCGCIVANTLDSRMKHVQFHKTVNGQS